MHRQLPTNAPIRLLHILGELKPSGAEMMYHAAAAMWQAAGLECAILSVGKTPGPLAPVLEKDGWRILHIPFSRSPLHVLRVLRLLSRRRYDIVHIDTERSNFWYALAAFLAGTPHLFRTVHSDFHFQSSLRLRRKWQRRVLRLLGLTTISISDTVARSEMASFANPSLQIADWFDNRRFVPPAPEQRSAARESLGIPDDVLAMVSIGNCSAIKNHRANLKAMAMLPADSQLLYLHAGIEDSASSERLLAAELGLVNRVRFFGWCADPLPLLHASDLYIMPSHHEGFGCAAFEALGAGLPAILSDVPGLGEIRRVCGEIVWCGTTPESIAAAILACGQLSPERRREMGMRASEAVHRRFGLEAGARRYAELYREAMERTPDAGVRLGAEETPC